MAGDVASGADHPSKARIFISYSRKDAAFADRLEAALKARGFEPLIDRAEIYALEDWWQRIQALIGRADTVVFVLSPDAVTSDVALKEVAHGAALNKRFAPIICRRVEDKLVPEPLRRLNFIFFDQPARFEASADQLAEALTTDIGWIRQHTEYGAAARRWVAANRPGGLLLRPPVLEEAERWIASRPHGAPEPTAETQTFVAESRRGATRRRNILTGSLAAGLVIALALAGVAYWQREIAVEKRDAALIAQSRYLAGEAGQLVGDGNVRGAVALLRVALPDAATGNSRPLIEDAVTAAYNALYSNRERSRLAMPSGASAVASDGHAGLFVIATADRLTIRKGLSDAGGREIAQNFGAPERLVLSADGARLAMVGRDGAIAVWDLNAQHELFRLGPSGSGTQAAFINAGDRLLVYSSNLRNWMLFDASTGRRLAARQFAPSGHAVVPLVDGKTGVIAVVAGKQLHRLSADDLSDAVAVPLDAAEQYALADTADGKTIYVAAAKTILEGRIFEFTADTLALKRSFGKFAGGASYLAVSRNAKVLALHGVIGIDFFDLQSGDRLNHFVVSGAAAPRGQFIASGDYIAYGPEGFIRRYVPELGTVSGNYRTIDGGAIVQIDEFADGGGFVTLSDRPSVTGWTFETETTSREYTVPLVLRGVDMKMAAPSEAFAVSSDRTRILVSYLDHSARLWEPETGAMRLVREADPKAAPIGFVASLANGTSVLGEKNGRLLIYTQAGGTTRPAAAVPTDPANFLGDVGGNEVLMIVASGAASLIDFSSPTAPKMEQLPQYAGCAAAGAAPGYSLCLKKNGSIAVLRVHDRHVVFERNGPADAAFASANISRDGDRIALCDSKGRLVVYATADAAVIARATLTMHLRGENLRAAAGSSLLSDADRAKISAGATTLDVPAAANLMALSPDGSVLALGMPDRTLRLIDLASGQSRHIANRRALAEDLQFSPHGRLLGVIEKSQYESLDVYDTMSGERIASIGLNGQASPRLAALDDGRGFATMDKSGRLIVHPVFEADTDLVAFLVQKFPEMLTPAQRRAYFIE